MRTQRSARRAGAVGLAGLALLLAACGGPPPAAPAATAVEPAAESTGGAAEPAAAGGDATAGQIVFTGTCATCHGPDAHGLPGLGKDLHANAFVAERSDEDMVAFLKVGRPASDPLNTTKVDMPPKGGNPALDDEDLFNVVAYIRTLK
jgi:disulfide bond formation protein DsbB